MRQEIGDSSNWTAWWSRTEFELRSGLQAGTAPDGAYQRVSLFGSGWHDRWLRLRRLSVCSEHNCEQTPLLVPVARQVPRELCPSPRTTAARSGVAGFRKARSPAVRGGVGSRIGLLPPSALATGRCWSARRASSTTISAGSPDPRDRDEWRAGSRGSARHNTWPVHPTIRPIDRRSARAPAHRRPTARASSGLLETAQRSLGLVLLAKLALRCKHDRSRSHVLLTKPFSLAGS